jgi:ABC-type spermidine/putrescine transport system permease subunit II
VGGWDYYAALAKNNPLVVQSAEDPPMKVAGGEAWVGVASEYNFYRSAKKGDPIETVFPEEGVPLVTSANAILAKAPHPNAAKVFTDFLFDKDAQQLLADDGLYVPNEAVTYPKDKRPLKELKLIKVDPRRCRSGTTRSRRSSASCSESDDVAGATARPASGRGTARGRLDAGPAVWLLSAAILAVLVVAPLAILLVTAVRVPDGSGFSLVNFIEAFGEAIYRGPVGNSFIYATSVGILSVILGAPMAWLVTRTDMPGKAVVRTFTIAAFVTPSFLGATAYVILAGPNAGLFNVLYRAVTGAEGALVNIFSMTGLIYVTSLYTFPVVFILTSAALTATPADLEEAARIAGAGRLAVMRTITLPLALPAIVGGFILAFLEALVLFGAPAMLAIPARFHVMTTQIWAFFHYPPQVEVAAAYAMPLLGRGRAALGSAV